MEEKDLTAAHSPSFTDEERRGIAVALRGLEEEDSPAEFIFGGTVAYDAMVVRALRAVIGKGDLFGLVAELADRPACRAVATESGFYGCSRCGHEAWADEESLTPYCPMCGAEVAGR